MFHRTILAMAAVCCLSFAAHAAECDNTFDDTKAKLEAAGYPVQVISDADLPALVDQVEIVSGTEYGDVTRGFVTQVGNSFYLGLEVGGCLLPKIVLGIVPRLSGKDEAGRVGA